MKTVESRKLEAGRNYRVSAKEVLDLTDEFGIIGGYVLLKSNEKAIKETIDVNKDSFIRACDIVADGKNQIEVNGVLIYTVERPKYTYSEAIQKAEAKLKAVKEAFEKQNAPTSVTRTWAVKL